MTRADLEKLVRDVRTIAQRMPHHTMSATERRFVSERMLALVHVGQQALDNTLTVKD